MQLQMLFIAFCAVVPCAGQDMFIEDTINIRAVTVTAPVSLRHNAFNTFRIDTLAVSRNTGYDLGTFLREMTPLSVKLYGNSGLSSVSIRGLSGNHTLVTWNGISVTTPNTGQYDFFLLPVMDNSRIIVREGGADLGEITGSIGGQVDLSSEPADSNDHALSITTGAGSNKDLSSLVRLNACSNGISASSAVWWRKSENNFFYNTGNGDRERRENAAFETKGMMHDIFMPWRRSRVSAHIWFNETGRELPGPVTKCFGESQYDRSFRSAVTYRYDSPVMRVQINGGFVNDLNKYNNDSSSITGVNHSNIFVIRTKMNYRLNDRIDAGFNLGNEFQTASSLSFDGLMRRNILSAGVSVTATPSKRLRLVIQSREIFYSGSFAPAEFTGGVSFLASADGRNILKANISRNLKIPSMNDLFWNPGGNADLKPEISLGGEVTYSFAANYESGSKRTLDITMHAAEVHDLIQWVPGVSGYWSAQNIRSVFVRGMETRISSSAPVSFGRISWLINYSLTASEISSSDVLNDKSVGKQTIYTPYHHLNAHATAEYRFIHAGTGFITESRRYTTTDNSEWLPLSSQININAGARFRLFEYSVSLDLSVNNLLNSQWEGIPNYPMPLRTFFMKLKIEL